MVARNAEVSYSRLQSGIAAAGLKAEATLYQPIAFSSLRLEERYRLRTIEEKASTPLLNQNVLDERVKTLENGVKVRALTGADLSLSLRVSDRTNNIIGPLNNNEGQTTAALVLSLRQPLLRGAGRTAVETDLRIAEMEREIGLWAYRQQLLRMSAEALNVYWQLQRAQEVHRVRQQLLENARETLRDVQAREAGGRLAPTSEAEAAAMTAVRESELLRSAQATLEAESRIRVILDLPPEDKGWLLDAGQLPHAPSATPDELDARYRQALQQWPAFRIAQLRLEQSEQRLRFARNQRRPALDLQLNYGQHSLDRESRQAVNTALEDRYPDWSVGLSFEMPLGGTTRADAQYEAQALKRQQSELELQSTRNSLANDFAVRLEQFKLAFDDLAQLRSEYESRRVLHEAEEAQYGQGLSPRHRLLKREADLLESRLRLIDGATRVRLAHVALLLAEGSLLDAHSVVLEF